MIEVKENQRVCICLGMTRDLLRVPSVTQTILVTQAIAIAERLIGYAIRLNVSILDTGQRIHLQP